MARTALNIITGAMRKAGVLSRVESPSSDEANDALQTLNDIIGSLSNDGLFVYSETTESFTLSGGVSSYTIGSGGDFDTSRPLSILSMYYTDASGNDYIINQIDQAEYAGITTKSQQGQPEYFYYDNGYSLGTIKLYPVPQEDYTLNIISLKAVDGFASLSTAFDMPPGWGLFLTDALAISLAPEYGIQTPQETLLSYQNSLAALKKQKARMVSLNGNVNPQTRNIYTGWF